MGRAPTTLSAASEKPAIVVAMSASATSRAASLPILSRVNSQDPLVENGHVGPPAVAGGAGAMNATCMSACAIEEAGERESNEHGSRPPAYDDLRLSAGAVDS